MRFVKILLLVITVSVSHSALAGPGGVSGKITSLLAHGSDPAIRIAGNISPDLCDGGNYNWLYFQGTPEERSRIYSTALALSLTGKVVNVYTNTDGGRCRIHNIQITDGLN